MSNDKDKDFLGKPHNPKDDVLSGKQCFYCYVLNSGTQIYTHLPAFDFIQSLPVKDRKEIDTIILGLSNNPAIPLSQIYIFILPEIDAFWGHKLLFKLTQKNPTSNIKKIIDGTSYNNEIAEVFSEKSGIGTSLQIVIPKGSEITNQNIADYVRENNIDNSIIPFSISQRLETPEQAYYPPIDEVEFED